LRAWVQENNVLDAKKRVKGSKQKPDAAREKPNREVGREGDESTAIQSR